KPILLFMDEIDSIGMSRENYAGSSRENLKTTSSLLKLIQEAKDNNIIIIAATNRRNLIDAALLNRFQSEIYFGLYDEKGIKGLLKEKLGKIEKGKSLSENEEALSEISKELTGYSNRSIVHIIAKSAKIARRNSRSEITIETVRQAIKDCNFEKISDNTYRREKIRIGFGAPN
ncbi:MAG: AAA family ATPase, partial [Candidatus Gastranaerophilales bacterium]|nr:AAA family ATPase [Candidatus Gastranaerophilales bacterium]